MVIDDVLERNRAFARGRTAQPLPEKDRVALAVVACHDPRLDGLLREALGIEPGTAVLLRTAGAYIARDGDPLRSLAVAAFRYGLTEVLVVGHSSCRMAAFRASEFVDAFRARGVPREAFGSDDLRTWAGAAADPRRGVVASVAAIREAPFLPEDLHVTGAVLDDATGALEMIVRPGESLPGFELIGVSASPAATPTVAATPTPERTPSPGTEEPAPLHEESSDPVDAALELVSKVRSKAHLRDAVARLGIEFRGARTPVERLQTVEAFIRRAGGDAQEIREALADIRRRASASSPAEVAEAVARRIVERVTEG